MPILLTFTLLEKVYGWVTGRDTVGTMDMISSISSGIAFLVKEVLGLSVTILSYGWMVQHFAVFHVGSAFLAYVIAYTFLDFQGYWTHRWSHEINYLWNGHVIHHSSEEFNLACSLRTGFSFINLFSFFLLPAAILGIPQIVISIIAPFRLFAQFWYHTERIKKMGFLESFLITPSHHRVHHAINPEYLNRNYGQIFIIWDKLFGTFQKELPDVKPVYGCTRPALTWNPIKINFQHLGQLFADAWRTNNWQDRLRVWVMPTGWRPSDVEEKYPVRKIKDIYHFTKYNPQCSRALKIWTWVQMGSTVAFTLYFLGNIARIGSPNVFYYGGFIFLSIYAFTELMDGQPNSLVWETLKNVTGIGTIYYTGDWFGSDILLSGLRNVILAYFAISTLVTAFFCIREINPTRKRTKNTVQSLSA
jgi:sterol desaturase/sphingolipid hydroxylase (fatty acid hydroxylase superfamily)